MIAFPTDLPHSSTDGPRPINLRSDLPQIVDLLELVFHQRLNHAVSWPFGFHWDGQPLLWHVLWRKNVVPGFVWVQEGQIVGNISLIETSIPGRYLIANVAVHPQFRRQGIAYHLMQAVANWARQSHHHVLLLQVEQGNVGAVKLYENLGYQHIGVTNLWSLTHNRLRNLAVPYQTNRPDEFEQFSLRPLYNQEWRSAYEVDSLAFPTNLNWPEPLPSDYYRFSLGGWWQDFTAGRQAENWVAVDKQQKIIAVGSIISEWGRPHFLKLRVRPEWQGLVERPLLAKLIRRLLYMRQRPVHIEHLQQDVYTSELLQEVGFSIHRTLVTMQYFVH